MSQEDPLQPSIKHTTASAVALSGSCLLILYVLINLGALIPQGSPDIAWILRLGSSMINSSPFALVGLVLVHLAADLFPRDASIQGLRQRLAAWAVWAAVGFALLIPLLSVSALNQHHNQLQGQTIRFRKAAAKLTTLRAAVQTSQSLDELTVRLQTLNGPVLDRKDQALPLGTLKQQLETIFRQAEARINNQSSSRSLPSRWGLGLEIIRSALACGALAVAFAALARRRNSWNSLLKELQRWWQHNVQRRTESLFRKRTSSRR